MNSTYQTLASPCFLGRNISLGKWYSMEKSPSPQVPEFQFSGIHNPFLTQWNWSKTATLWCRPALPQLESSQSTQTVWNTECSAYTNSMLGNGDQPFCWGCWGYWEILFQSVFKNTGSLQHNENCQAMRKQKPLWHWAGSIRDKSPQGHRLIHIPKRQQEACADPTEHCILKQSLAPVCKGLDSKHSKHYSNCLVLLL